MGNQRWDDAVRTLGHRSEEQTHRKGEHALREVHVVSAEEQGGDEDGDANAPSLAQTGLDVAAEQKLFRYARHQADHQHCRQHMCAEET
jgi:hypothetical protein